MDNQQFENLITAAVEALPERIREKLNNVEIVMEEGESPNNSLFGLYHGVSQLNRGSTYGMNPTLPDKITIWKGTIERFAGTEENIPSLVRRVVWHEIGHHFGFDEPGIRRLEEKWAKENKI
ncbi:MAG: metallopeptidase family protein [Candidatus Doudnabacteria bacterium]|nr:metallopeptidase family protein [Candidatus Doudnabacteria bacterium]